MIVPEDNEITMSDVIIDGDLENESTPTTSAPIKKTPEKAWKQQSKIQAIKTSLITNHFKK